VITHEIAKGGVVVTQTSITYWTLKKSRRSSYTFHFKSYFDACL